ncbi:amidase [Rhizobium leguminosarum]|uniref:amidase n=1 Tax=Rhizobium leguminosarum TaxID=384 RepID=UPI00103CABA8|nr:amidase [Rhizobium leguminosarum]TBY24085.1 amidase [Rhizobium leguminosarum bv. viciae]TBY34773.1 amidase [Rhizobium leguminosarum bv. viciae]TBY93535.1 amidase [Rhizobium leguminosarum bv. viciae]
MLRDQAQPAFAGLDLLYASALTQAAMVREGSISSEALVALAIQRAKDTTTDINCIAVPRYERALEDARHIDVEIARRADPGPLCGVPVTVKDGIATVGDRQTFGSLSMVDVIAERDDVVWARLKATGAVLIGKTATPEFYHEVTTHSALHGVTRNPWSLELTPGGSSGGAAAALAAGIGSVAVGSDGGGSLRCPAACTGTLALKPTVGRIPHESFPDTFGNYSSMGPMAHCVEDLVAMYAIMSGPTDADALSSLARVADGSRCSGNLEGTRIGWLANPGGYLVETEISDRCSAVLGVLERAGASLQPDLEPGLLDGAHAIYRVIGAVGHAGRLRQLGASARPMWVETFRDIVDLGMSFSAADLAQAQEARTALFRRVQHAFRHVDVIATPSLTRSPGPAAAQCPVHGEDYAAWAAALYPFNLTGHPAISVPCGFTSEGLPVGIQFVARWHDEERLFDLAAAVQAASLGWTERPSL